MKPLSTQPILIDGTTIANAYEWSFGWCAEWVWEFEFRAMQCSLILHNRYTGERSKIQYAMPIEAKPPKAKRKAAQ